MSEIINTQDFVSCPDTFLDAEISKQKEIAKPKRGKKTREDILNSLSEQEKALFLLVEKKVLEHGIEYMLRLSPADSFFYSDICEKIQATKKEKKEKKESLSPAQEQAVYEDFLTERYNFRLVTLRDDIEYKRVSSEAWIEVRDTQREEITREAYTVISKLNVNRLWTTIIYLAAQNTYNPFVAWIDALPEWNGEDHIKKLLSFIKFRRDHSIFSNYRRFEAACCQAMIRWYPALDRKDKVCCFVLVSPREGIGKSRLVYEMVPIKEKFIDNDLIKVNDKDFFLSQVKYMVREISELTELLRRTSDDEMKNTISRDKVSVRKAYGRSEIEKRVNCFLFGTANNPGDLGFLRGHENSRYIVCEIDSIDWQYKKEMDWKQFWAQIFYLTKQDRFLLSREELQAQREINSGYKEDNPLKDLILDKYIITGKKTDLVKGKDFLDITKDHKIRHQDIPYVLAVLGVGKKTTNKGKFYWGLREKTETEREEEKTEFSQDQV